MVPDHFSQQAHLGQASPVSKGDCRKKGTDSGPKNANAQDFGGVQDSNNRKEVSLDPLYHNSFPSPVTAVPKPEPASTFGIAGGDPRACKRRPKQYPLLTNPRRQAKAALLKAG